MVGITMSSSSFSWGVGATEVVSAIAIHKTHTKKETERKREKGEGELRERVCFWKGREGVCDGIIRGDESGEQRVTTVVTRAVAK